MEIKPPGDFPKNFPKIDEATQRKSEATEFPNLIQQPLKHTGPVEKKENTLVKNIKILAGHTDLDSSESVRKAIADMVKIILKEQFGPHLESEKGFDKMQTALSELINNDPFLSDKVKKLLARLTNEGYL